MRYAPAMTQQLGALHQRDLLAQADVARRVAQIRATDRVSAQQETPIQMIKANLTTLRMTLLLHPRAAIAGALVAALLLGPDGVEAGKNLDRVIIGGSR